MGIFHLNYTLFIKIYILCYINDQIFINCNNINNQTSLINNSSTFQSKENTIFIYNQTSELKCKLTTTNIQYFNDTKTTFLIKPIIILFDKTHTPTWNIKAQEAKMTHKKIIYLCGQVQIHNLIKNPYLQLITTNTVVLNLLTYDIFSNEKITIHGIYFNTVAMSMRGNLNKKITELQKVHTLYERKNSKKI